MRQIARIVLLAAVCSAISAQQPKGSKPQTPRGAVTGTIYCADTNTPARLAQIVLLPVIKQNGQTFIVQSDLEGRFAISRVPEGTYYVSAKFDGYLDPFPRFAARGLSGLSPEERKELDALAIRVSVAADQTATIAVRLERAAAVEGTVLYDDGSPGIGLHITIRPKQDQAEKKPAEEPVAILMFISEAFQRITDDHGHFRALGLAPGEYLVSTTVSAASGAAPSANPLADAVKSSPSGSLVVYYGDTTRKSTAKSVKIERGETVSGTDITIPLSKLHNIRGQVLLKSTEQPPASASLQILYADDRELARMAIAPNGEFELDYLPEGSYILQASASTDSMLPAYDQDNSELVITGGNFFSSGDSDFPSNFRQDGAAEIPLDVHGELTGVTISVPDPSVKKDTASGPGSIPAPPAPPPQ
jgi:hypothetical protein